MNKFFLVLGLFLTITTSASAEVLSNKAVTIFSISDESQIESSEGYCSASPSFIVERKGKEYPISWLKNALDNNKIIGGYLKIEKLSGKGIQCTGLEIIPNPTRN